MKLQEVGQTVQGQEDGKHLVAPQVLPEVLSHPGTHRGLAREAGA